MVVHANLDVVQSLAALLEAIGHQAAVIGDEESALTAQRAKAFTSSFWTSVRCASMVTI